MQKTLSIIIAIFAGLLVLVGFFLKPLLDPVLLLILRWGIIVGSMAAIVGIINLLLTHIKRIRFKEGRFGFSFVVLIGFVASFSGALLFGTGDQRFTQWLSAIQVPIEVSLMAMVALTLTYAGVNFFRLRGWTPLSISFGISAIVFLVMGIGFIQSGADPMVDQVISFIRLIPLAGGRGILIGISLGALLTGLRVLFGTERPYGD
jgi:hypothetical protein